VWTNEDQKDMERDRMIAKYGLTNADDEAHWESVYENHQEQTHVQLYSSPEVIPEAIGEIRRILDDESDLEFLKTLTENLSGLPYEKDAEVNVIESHARLMRIRNAFDQLCDSYARALTAEETGIPCNGR
jgi:hypothetical protein